MKATEGLQSAPRVLTILENLKVVHTVSPALPVQCCLWTFCRSDTCQITKTSDEMGMGKCERFDCIFVVMCNRGKVPCLMLCV